MFRGIYFLVIFCLLSGKVAAAEDRWNLSKSTHFIVYYKSAQENFVSNIIDSAEGYYNKIADNLGFRRFNFWTWDERGKIYIFDDAASYQAETGQPAWSAGCAFSKEKTIYTYLFAKNFIDVLFAHELGHIIFREFVGFNNTAVPLWLDEGVASYQEKSRLAISYRIVSAARKNGGFMNLEQLSAFVPAMASDTDAVHIFYAESVVLVDYLIKKFGSDQFASFCQIIRDKMDFMRAIRSVYGFNTMSEFDQAWQRYLSKYN